MQDCIPVATAAFIIGEYEPSGSEVHGRASPSVSDSRLMNSTMSTYGNQHGAIDALVFGADQVLVSAARDGAIRCWGANGTLLHATERGSYHVLSAGPQLVAGSTSGELVWLDWRARTVLRSEQAMEEGITTICARADGTVAVGGDSCTVRLYDANGRLAWVGETYKWPYAMRWSPDGQRLLIATWDAYLYELDMDALPSGTIDEPHEIPYPATTPHAGMPFFDMLCVGSERVALSNAGEGGEPSVFLVRRGEPDFVASLACGAIHALALSPDGRSIAGGGNEQVVFVWDAETLVERARFVLDGDTLTAGRPLADNVTAPTRAADDDYPAYAGYHPARSPASIFSLAWHPSGEELFAGTQSGAIVQLRL